MNDLDLKALWQGAEDDEPPVDFEEMQSRASAFERKVRRRNALEWLASVFVILWFGRDAVYAETSVEMVGNWLVVGATIGVAVYLYLKGRVTVEVDPGQDTRTYVEAHANALDEQSRLLATVPLWYLGPLSVGMGVLMLGRMPIDGRPMGGWLGVVGLVIITFLGIAWLNRRGARTLRDEATSLRAELD
jgi:hypothetical protein